MRRSSAASSSESRRLLTGSDLSGAVLITANLCGARLDQCKLWGANLAGARLVAAGRELPLARACLAAGFPWARCA